MDVFPAVRYIWWNFICDIGAIVCDLSGVPRSLPTSKWPFWESLFYYKHLKQCHATSIRSVRTMIVNLMHASIWKTRGWISMIVPSVQGRSDLGLKTCIQYGHCSSCQNKSIMVTDRESGHGMRWSASCQRDWTMYFIGHRDDQVFRHDTSCSCCAASWFDTRELKSIVEQLRPWCPCLPRCVIDDLKYSFILCIFLLV